jgi:hypothetical protein
LQAQYDTRKKQPRKSPAFKWLSEIATDHKAITRNYL